MINNWPKISIITPSYNQGSFIEETIQSVLGQCYPNLEYIIMDGGSTDNTVEVIKKYEKQITFWTSEKDCGQSAAINTGFGRATGEILAWLNSDDFYLPGALDFAARNLDTTIPQVLFGNCIHCEENSINIAGSDVVKGHQATDLDLGDYIIQPSSFWTKQAWESIGELDENLIYGFDWEWFLRAKHKNTDFLAVAKYLSVYRIHGSHKTGTGGGKRQAEFATIYEKFAGTDYRDLYLECCKSGEEVNNFLNRFGRYRSHKIITAILRLKFPNLFRNASLKDVCSILQMR